MPKQNPTLHLAAAPLSRSPQASLKELRARARRLRLAIAGEPTLQKIVDLFSEGFLDQDAFIDLSHETDDARFAAILGPDGPLGTRFPGEAFYSRRSYMPELELLHASLLSGSRMGFAIQFAREPKGLIAVYTFGPGSRWDCFRYTLILEHRCDARAPTFATRGGSA